MVVLHGPPVVHRPRRGRHTFTIQNGFGPVYDVQIKDNSVTSQDIKNKSLKVKDLSPKAASLVVHGCNLGP